MKETELIMNEDGSVYHLALKPGEVSDTVITVGDPHRVRKVSQFFDQLEIERHKREFVTHTGTFRGQRLTVISTGIGTDNVDIVMNELHSLKQLEGSSANPFRFVRLGTSGAIQTDIDIDSILISEYALGFDGLLHFYKHAEDSSSVDQLLQDQTELSALPRPYATSASPELLTLFESLGGRLGVTVTAPGFYAPQGRSINAPARLEDFVGSLSKSNFKGKAITNIEMETAGIYGLASLFGHQAISISAILANRISGQFSKDPEKVVDQLIRSSLEILTD